MPVNRVKPKRARVPQRSARLQGEATASNRAGPQRSLPGGPQADETAIRRDTECKAVRLFSDSCPLCRELKRQGGGIVIDEREWPDEEWDESWEEAEEFVVDEDRFGGE